MTRGLTWRASWVSVVLIAAMLAPTGDASARRKRLKPDGTRFIAWLVQIETISGASHDTTLTVALHDAAERDPLVTKRPRLAKKRYTVKATVNGRTLKKRGHTVVFPLRRADRDVRVEVVDRYGADWSGTVHVDTHTQATLTLTSRWTKPTWKGRFVNWTHRCPRDQRHMLKFTIKIPGDLYVGDSVKLRPGKAKRGPELPEGEYEVELFEYRARKWRPRPSGLLVVRPDEQWKFVGSCDLAAN